jgi:hypothetical protein
VPPLSFLFCSDYNESSCGVKATKKEDLMKNKMKKEGERRARLELLLLLLPVFANAHEG